jgi:hypothetical protein
MAIPWAFNHAATRRHRKRGLCWTVHSQHGIDENLTVPEQLCRNGTLL